MNQEVKYYIPDMETGFKVEVSKEQWERYQNAWEYCRPKIDGFKGKVIIFGTMGDFDNQNFNEFYDR